MTVKSTVVSWNRKWASMKNLLNPNKEWSLCTRKVPILISQFRQTSRGHVTLGESDPGQGMEGDSLRLL